jgi:hypothetical protein
MWWCHQPGVCRGIGQAGFPLSCGCIMAGEGRHWLGIGAPHASRPVICSHFAAMRASQWLHDKVDVYQCPLLLFPAWAGASQAVSQPTMMSSSCR